MQLGRALVFFAAAKDSPAGASEAELSDVASRLLSRLVGREIPVLYAHQEHTRLTFSFSSVEELAPGGHLVGRCDGLLTAESNVALLVRTADCLPIAFAWRDTVAMVHAGWRGLAADILGATVGRLAAEYGVPGQELSVVIGVGISECHYEVGEDVIEALGSHRVIGREWLGNNRVSLAGWARGRLRALGIPSRNIRVLEGCTACSRGFHSFRRDGPAAGRQWSAVVLTGR